MKKLIFLCGLIIILASCKKDPAADIVNYNWVLSSAVSSPAITFNGKTSTDLRVVFGAESCYKDLTYVFSIDGTYVVGSTGALCDMEANNKDQKWSRNGDVITVTRGANALQFAVNKNRMVTTDSITINAIKYKTTLTYVAKNK